MRRNDGDVYNEQFTVIYLFIYLCVYVSIYFITCKFLLSSFCFVLSLFILNFSSILTQLSVYFSILSSSLPADSQEYKFII